MKKFIRTSKKTLSVFMAALMVLTAWVFFEPTKASAIDAGSYYVEIRYQIKNKGGESKNKYLGKSKSFQTHEKNEDNCVGISLFYKTNNGTGTENEVYWNIGNSSKEHGQASGSGATVETPTGWIDSTTNRDYYARATVPGFPTSLFALCDYASATKVIYEIYEVKVGSSSSNMSTLWSGTLHFDSSWNAYYGTLSNGNWSSNSSSYASGTTTTKNWSYPTASSIEWSTSPSNITVPNSSSTVKTTAVTYCKDQYGVRLGVNPTYSYFSNPVNNGLSGSQSNGTANSTYTVSATNAALMSGQGNNSTEASITASYTFNNQKKEETKTFTVSDPTQTVKLNANGGMGATADITRQWGDEYGVDPTATRNGYSLIGFYQTAQGPFLSEDEPTGEKLTSDTVVTGNSTWYAAWRANKYKATFSYKDENWEDATSEQSVYYTDTLSAPEIPTVINHGDYTETFTGWSAEVPSTMPANDVHYTALYDQKINYADYTELEKNLALAKAKMEEDLYKDGAYVPALVTAFENAYNQALASDNNKLYASHQSDVDALSKSLSDALANLKLKTFTVLFVDENGNILENGYHYVNYGDKVTVPTPVEEPTATSHFVFKSWDSEDSDDFSACDYVIEDLKFIAIFDEVEHSFTEERVDSTCTADGVIKKTCSVCGYSYTEANPDDTASHKFEEKTIQEATCGQIGIKANVCSVCGAIEKDSVKEIAATGNHSFGDWETVTEATCISKGVRKHTCSVCGEIEIEEIPEIAHDYEEVTVDATCTTDGYTVQRCKVCANEKEKTVIPATGHQFETKSEPATCTSVGYEVKYCTVCDYQDSFKALDMIGHKWSEWTVTQEATCTNSEISQRTCSVCSATETKVGEKIDHSWGDWTTEIAATCTQKGIESQTCANCSQKQYRDIAKLEHKYETTVEKATCTQAGHKVTKCTLCGDVTEDEVLQPLGHNWGEWTETTGPDCETEGESTRTCSVCDATETKSISALGHKWGEWKVIKPSTNDEDGTMQRVCSRNGAHTEEVSIPKGGHEFGEMEVVKPATCEESGTGKYTCTAHDNCGITLEVEIPATGHDYVGTVTKEATCTEKGEMTYICKNDSTHTYTEEIPAKGHSFGEGKVVAPTCETEGYTEYTCTECGYVKRDNVQPALGHNYVEETVAPTCTEFGYTKHTCKNNENHYYIDEVKNPTGHSWNDGEITTEATCTDDGVKTFTCTAENCGATKTEAIPAKGHSWVEESRVKPTNNANGKIVYKCENCDETREVVLEAQGHTFVEDEAQRVDATCETNGSKVFVCTAHTDCGLTYTETIPALGHNWELTKTVEATCTTDGENTYTCKNDESHKKTETIAKLGHSYELTNTVEATCEADGYDEYTCSVCKDVKRIETANALGHNWTRDVVAPTCEKAGYTNVTCANDPAHNHIENVVNPTGHSWNDGKITTEATCTTDGVKTYTCQNDETHTKTEAIPATGHSWVEASRVEPTNEANGKIVYKCENCDETREVVLKAQGHKFTEVNRIDATCEKTGTITYVCSAHENCGLTYTETIPALGHNWELTKTVDATCTTDGEKTYTCKNDPTHEKTETIAKLGHSYVVTDTVPATCETEGYIEYKCETCGDVKRDSVQPALGHDWTETVTNPTCEEPGYTTVTCARDSSHDYIKDVTNPTGHSYTSKVTKEATCTEDGVKTFTCQNDKTHTYTEAIPATGHSWVEDSRVEPTNDKAGYILYKCQNDGCTAEYKVTLAPQEHEFEEVSRVDATCTENGSITYKCKTHTGDKDCGLTYTDTIPALGHSYDSGTVTKAATCTEDGVMTYTCTRCEEGTDGHTKEAVIPKTGHKMEGVRTAATCLTDAYWTYTCQNDGCDHTYIIVEKNSKAAHDFSVTKVDPTCTSEGLTTYTCKNCGYSYTAKIPALGHNWGDWVTVKEATCSEAGTQMRTCLNDKTHTQTRQIPSTGEHTYVPTVVKPTCTQLGFTILACTGCGVSIRTDFKPALGHDFDDGVYEQATCTTDGGTRYTCRRDGCGYSYFVKDTDALGHDMGQWYFTAHPTEKNAFAKRRDCNRKGCTEFELERGEDGTVNVYYSVEYINDWVAKDENSYFVAADGTKLVKASGDIFKSVSLGTIYVLKGEKAEYPEKINPSREATEAYGAYTFTGWSLDQNDASLDAVTKNITAHAQFKGKDVYYKIAFFNANGTQLTNEQTVLHGHAAVYDEYYKNPTMPNNLYYKFNFKYWTRTTNKEGTQNTYDKIYSSGSFTAVYDNIPLEYKVIYHDWNGDVLGSEIFHYSKPVNAPTGLVRQEDASYIYQFTNKWQTAEGYNADINALTVPNTSWKEYDPANENNEDMTDAQKGILHIYAKYAQTPKIYRVRIAAVDTDGSPIPGATVQVIGSNGQFVTATKLGENSEVVLSLHYDSYYTVQVTYQGNVAQKTFAIADYSFENGNIPTVARMILDKASTIDPDQSDDCSCICHTFLSRIWITFLNIIYRLFGKKTVCCYDMYEKHGDKLAYGK